MADIRSRLTPGPQAPCAAIPGSGPASCTDMPAGGSCNMLGSRSSSPTTNQR